MCLKYDEKLTNQLIKTSKKEHIFYKVFQIIGGTLRSPYQKTIWGKIKNNKFLVIKSNRKNIKLTNIEIKYQEVDRGIHVFKHKIGALCDKKEFDSLGNRTTSKVSSYVVLPVICKKKDLVAVGLYDVPAAVFMQVKVDISSVNKSK